MSLPHLVCPEDRVRLDAFLRDPLAPIELRLTTASGKLIWVRLFGDRLSEGTRRFLLEDIDGAKRTEQDLRTAKEHLELATLGSSDGSWDWDILRDEAYLSPRWLELLGYSPGDLPPTLQAWQGLLHPADSAENLASLRDHLAGKGAFHVEHRMRTKTGEYRWFLSRGQILRDEEGEPVRMAGTLKDIHERKLIELQMRHWHNRHEAAIAASGHVIYEWDALTDTTEWNGNLQAMLGEGCQMPSSLADWVSHVHPADKERVLAAYDNFVLSAGRYREEYRVLRTDGSYLHIEDSAQVFLDGSGHPTRIVGWLMDVSERKRLERSLLEANELLEQRVRVRTQELEAMHQTLALALEGSHEGVWEWSTAEGLKLSDVLANLLGLAGIRARVTVHPDDAPEMDRRFEAHRHDETPIFESEHRVRDHAGQWIWVLVRGKAVTRDTTGLATRIVGTAGDIGPRKLLDAQLREAMAAANVANRAKSMFLAAMSHEIRTPMNGVVGMAELLAGTALSNEQHDCVQHILSSSENLLGVINDILDFSKIEAGKLEIETIAFDPARLAEETVDLLMPRAAAQDLELRYAPDLRIDRFVLGDPSRTRQVLLNLLSNAVKFTPSGSVELRLSLAGNGAGETPRLRFDVVDTGIGLSPETAALLFQPFSQADAATTRRFGGTGLGLAISRQLVELMGGAIGASGEPGAGAHFWFELPLVWTSRAGCLSAANLPPGCRVSLSGFAGGTDEPAIRRWLDVWGVEVSAGPGALSIGGPELLTPADENRGLLRIALLPWPAQRPSGTAPDAAASVLSSPCRPAALLARLGAVLAASASPHAAAGRPEQTGSLSRARILLVEDNPVNQRVAIALLRRQGATVDLAENGRVAIAKAEAGGYDVILMDCHMPELDGFEATRRIRAAEASPHHIPIIAMTASAMADDRERCMASGMDDFISKPVQTQRLVETVSRWLPELFAS